jgi:hypothetical protein
LVKEYRHNINDKTGVYMASKFTVLIIAIGLALVSPTITATIITPIAAKASSTFPSSNPLQGYSVDNLINNSGISVNNAGHILHDENFYNMWMSDQETSAKLVFDLGGNYLLSGAYIWQYNATGLDPGRGVNSFDILASTDGFSYNLVRHANLSQFRDGTILIEPEYIPFNQTARYVQLAINSNFNGKYVGVSEVKFEAQAAMATTVPEPQAMLMLALALMALLMLRGYWPKLGNIH